MSKTKNGQDNEEKSEQPVKDYGRFGSMKKLELPTLDEQGISVLAATESKM